MPERTKKVEPEQEEPKKYQDIEWQVEKLGDSIEALIGMLQRENDLPELDAVLLKLRKARKKKRIRKKK